MCSQYLQYLQPKQYTKDSEFNFQKQKLHKHIVFINKYIEAISIYEIGSTRHAFDDGSRKGIKDITTQGMNSIIAVTFSLSQIVEHITSTFSIKKSR